MAPPNQPFAKAASAIHVQKDVQHVAHALQPAGQSNAPENAAFCKGDEAYIK